MQGTDQFAVDTNTGVVTVTRPIDRESQTGISDNEIRYSVTSYKSSLVTVTRPIEWDSQTGISNNEISILLLDTK